MFTREKAITYLRRSLQDEKVDFREGQYESIDAVVNKKQKVLVVQRTGWGKSIVYFLTTKYLRETGRGLTIIISPLLALMRNQIEAALRIGLKVATINSNNTDEWGLINKQILNDEIDALLISPERLSNEDFLHSVLAPIASSIGLFVVDEAHCISDWGHDFRPDYRRIVNILKLIPENTPILTTTATANNRVINDIKGLIKSLVIIKGSLTRDSISLKNIILPDVSQRLAWLAQNVPFLNGSGIIYVLTVRDAKLVANWLNLNNISAAAYYGDVDKNNSEISRPELEQQLLNNQIKVLVATSALGMGFDKPDLGFVIHFQAPNSIIAYYQQVGRAGRGIDNAFGILLSGQEDSDIHDFFRKSAFPSKENIDLILNELELSDGLSIYDLMKQVNVSKSKIEHAIKYLSVEESSPVIKQGNKWCRTANTYKYDTDRVNSITEIRLSEWQQMQEYINSKNCLMNYLQEKLDDTIQTKCGKCSNCRNADFNVEFPQALGLKAVNFLKENDIEFKSKIQIIKDSLSDYGIRAGNMKREMLSEDGKILSRWKDAGWGMVVAKGKEDNCFSDELIKPFIEMIRRWENQQNGLKLEWVTCVPSLNHPTMVPDFARKIANKLNIPFIQAVVKVRKNEQQKFMNNSYQQAKNLNGVFNIVDNIPHGNVLLIDDVIDSGWTVSVISMLLKQSGCGRVYPAALSTTGKL